MNQCDRRPDDDLCECQSPGSFNCGVPGVLAYLENGRVATGAVVERCDSCERFESDAAARQKLVELGLLEALPQQPNFTVYAYAIVWTKHEVAAATSRDAARAIIDGYEWGHERNRAEFADDFGRFVVETDGRRSEEFDGFLNILPQ